MNDNNPPVVVVSNIVKRFYNRKPGTIRRKNWVIEALKGVSLQIRRGEIVSVVGESGCGKSTLAKSIALLLRPDSGTISINGTATNSLSRNNLNSLGQKIHLIFQDPYSSLNPRLSVGEIIMEPLIIQKVGSRRDRINSVVHALSDVGLRPSDFNKYPHQFSGGQRQRVAIARALISNPDLIIADEPLSALDVSIQSQIINLLMDLKKKRNLTYLFISHDLSVVSHVADKVVVMYKGHVVESGTAESVFHSPLHPYTNLLVSSTPELGKKKRQLCAQRVVNIEPGNDKNFACLFYNHCHKASEICHFETPSPNSESFLTDKHLAKCHFPGHIKPKMQNSS